MKKMSKVILSMLLVLGLTACGNKTAYKAGTYSETVDGHNGKVTVEVKVSSDKIESVTVTEQQETVGIADPALNTIPGLIVEHQSLGIDTISGCTVTSNAILSAAAAAIKKAGGDVDALKNVKVEKIAGDAIEKTADVIVIGGGGAGISAAVAAASEGKSVILIEKTAALGGNTMASGGVWNAVNAELDALTPMSEGRITAIKSYLELDETMFVGEYKDTFNTLKNQINEYLKGDTSTLFDSVEFHLIQSYMGGLRSDLDGNQVYGQYDLLSTLVNNSNATIQWLKDTVGSEFNNTLGEPIGSLWLRAQTAKNSKSEDLFVRPAAYVETNGGEIIFNCTADELLTEEGKVVGVHATLNDGTEVVLHANNGVVLATGGFGANTEMVMEYDNYWGDRLYDTIGTTNVGSTVGEGITMSQSAVDAAVVGMEFTQMMPIGYASNGKLALGNGTNVMYVTPEGVRFVDEYAERDVISLAAFEFGGDQGLFYEIGMKSNVQFFQDDDCFEADTIEELAALVGMDPAVLQAEVEKYNSFVDAGKDTDFGKTVFTTKIETADGDKYIARAMKPSIHHTMGGLKIDVECHVYNTNGEVIPGLYAAGEVVGGIHAGNRLGGNAIADVYTFGRIAGTNAAQAK